MNFKRLNMITAFLSLINSLFYLLAPVFSLVLMSRTTNPVGLLNTRMAGACALGITIITWQSRNITERQFQNIVCAGNLAMFVALVAVEILGLWSGAFNWVGYLFVTADSLLAIGYAWIYLKTRGKKN
ncbi:MAG: hypothetical protein P8046_14840 [Anaerolineales bacterium]|jgi:hypothetical protein